MSKSPGQHQHSHSLQIHRKAYLEHETKVWKIQSIKKCSHEFNKRSYRTSDRTYRDLTKLIHIVTETVTNLPTKLNFIQKEIIRITFGLYCTSPNQ